jgi:hypothetical protein
MKHYGKRVGRDETRRERGERENVVLIVPRNAI